MLGGWWKGGPEDKREEVVGPFRSPLCLGSRWLPSVGGAVAVLIWGRLGLNFLMKKKGGGTGFRTESQEGRSQARKLLTTHSHD